MHKERNWQNLLLPLAKSAFPTTAILTYPPPLCSPSIHDLSPCILPGPLFVGPSAPLPLNLTPATFQRRPTLLLLFFSTPGALPDTLWHWPTHICVQIMDLPARCPPSPEIPLTLAFLCPSIYWDLVRSPRCISWINLTKWFKSSYLILIEFHSQNSSCSSVDVPAPRVCGNIQMVAWAVVTCSYLSLSVLSICPGKRKSGIHPTNTEFLLCSHDGHP